MGCAFGMWIGTTILGDDAGHPRVPDAGGLAITIAAPLAMIGSRWGGGRKRSGC